MAKGFNKPPKGKSYPHPIINVIHLGRIKPGSSDIFWLVAYEGTDELTPEIENIAAKNKNQAIQEFLKAHRNSTPSGNSLYIEGGEA
jgi:hypothetical protein